MTNETWRAGLLPCPFCGGEAEFKPYKKDGLTIKCKSFGCVRRDQRVLRQSIDWLREAMAKDWNTRTNPPPVDAADDEESICQFMTQADVKNLRAVKGMYVRITWSNGTGDWPYFRLLSISQRDSMIKLRVLGSPDGSSKHAGDEYWMDWCDVESIVPVVVGAG